MHTGMTKCHAYGGFYRAHAEAPWCESAVKKASAQNMPFMADDTLVVQPPQDLLPRVKNDKNFVVVTTEHPHEGMRPNRIAWANAFSYGNDVDDETELSRKEK
jgi:hypothetical protein